MQVNTRRKLKIALRAAGCCLSLFSCVFMTFAWFASNKTVGGNGMDITAAQDSDVQDYAFYKATDSSAMESGYVFEKCEDRDSASMGAYDVLKSTYQLILRVRIKKKSTSVRFIAETDTNYFLGASASGVYRPLLSPVTVNGTPVPDDAGKDYTNALTSVAGVVLLRATDFTSTGQTALNMPVIPPSERIATFIDKSQSINTVKPANIELTASVADGTLIDGEDGFYHAFFMFTYDSALVSAVLSVNVGNAAIDGNAAIPFRSDFRITLSGGAET